MAPQLNIVVSVNKRDLMGVGTGLAYRWTEDLRRFKRITKGDAGVIMGRATWDALPSRPLPGRRNFVLTSQPTEAVKGAEFINSVEEAISKVEGEGVLWCIGGAKTLELIFARYAPLIKLIALTRFDLDDDEPSQAVRLDSTFLQHFSRAQVETHEDVTVSDWCDRTHNTRVHFETWVATSEPTGESAYLELMRNVLAAPPRVTRNAHCLSLFGKRLVYDCRHGRVPLLTSKRMAWRTVIRELLWFVRGETDNRLLQAQNVHIWDGNSSKAFLETRGLEDYIEGDCGPIYGFQWRHFGASYEGCDADYTGKGVDQLLACEQELKTMPYSRRILLSAWNPSALDKMVLPPCHVLCQFYVEEDNTLSMQLYQRSGDLFLGVPFNMFSYAVLLHIMAARTGRTSGKLVHILGDVHIYNEHVDAVKEQLRRCVYVSPTLEIVSREKWEDYTIDDFCLNHYKCGERLSAPMIA